MATEFHSPPQSSSLAHMIHTREMIRADLPEVLAIEDRTYGGGWTEDDFLRALRQRGKCFGLVAEGQQMRDHVTGPEMYGYAVYSVYPDRYHLMNMAVDPIWRRRGIGSSMIDKLKQAATRSRRRYASCEVRESNLGAQLFFKAMGFKAIRVHRGYYEDTNEDAYEFRFKTACGEPDDHREFGGEG